MPTYKTPTETALRDWSSGSTTAERLAAAVLLLEGFADIDPQAPLGGADYGKDILCTKGGKQYVAAVYFPPTEKRFSSIRKKFRSDLDGSKQHKRDGIVFLTNQHLTIAERDELVALALSAGKECLIYNRERLRATLDAPTGYGIRFGFLRIPMSVDEQFTYFVQSRNTVEYAIERNSRELSRISGKIEQLLIGQDYAIHSLRVVAEASGHDVGDAPLVLDMPGGGGLAAEKAVGPLSSNLSPELICLFHRLSSQDLPPRMVGKLRNETVWLGKTGTGPDDAVAIPPAPEKVPQELTKLCRTWNAAYSELTRAKFKTQLERIAHFHVGLLTIHPFIDGNGRTSRAIMMQQCIDLFGTADITLFDRGAAYYQSLREANANNFDRLIELIEPIVRG